MKISLGSLCLLLLLASSTVSAASLPPALLESLSGTDAGSNSLAFTPAASNVDSCGIPVYSCQTCPQSSAPLKLCSVTNCGTYVIVHCDPCAPECHLPPA
jgi:hypothetical protein